MSTKIGSFMGLDVYAVASFRGVIEFRNGSTIVQRVAVDHPHLQGTEIVTAARGALAAEKSGAQ